MAKELIFTGQGSARIPAVQYIRMSTEHQRYSPDNQRLFIASFAAHRGFEILETYEDSGKSGLTLDRRPALKRLLADVLRDGRKFRAILVLDVSRWGRFQDLDQAAHYEYMCQEAGISVHYCAEPFDNDGSAMGSVVKHLKRVMAAEFSRELSVKVSKAQRHLAGLGFKQGSSCAYALRRQVVDDLGVPRGILKFGQRKSLSTHKIVYARGSAKEVAIVRRVFELFVYDRIPLTEIARWVNRNRQKQSNGSRWTHATVRRILGNPLYIGDYIFGRKLNNLGNEVALAESDWVRTKVLEPIIPLELFETAQKRLVNTRQVFNDEEVLAGMSRLLAEKGVLTHKVIIECPYVPSPTTIVKRFGSMAAAYKLIDYKPPKYFPPNSEGRRYTRAELLARLRRLHDDYGFISVRMINDDELLPSYNYICACVGGISRILSILGLPVTVESQRLATLKRTQRDLVGTPGRFKPRKHRNPDGSPVSDEQLVSHLKRLLSVHGHLTAEIVSKDPHCPDPQLFRRRLGSMPRAYALAGYAGSRREIALAAHARKAATKEVK
jgi:DNA invertase Pin-like site-specific DNA recombinase